MKMLAQVFLGIVISLFVIPSYSKQTLLDNQTALLSPVLPVTGLPFRILIERASFDLPVGIHSGVFGVYKGQWIFIAGRLNGLHGFNGDPFPPDEQNTEIYVVNPRTGDVYSRSLRDPGAGITQYQIDTLSVTSPQGYQLSNTLYMTGGYGLDTEAGQFVTMPVLTAFNLPGIVDWVMQPNNPSISLSQHMRQLIHPIFQITGGRMFSLGNTTQLVFGQDFEGEYTPGSNGNYSDQVRRFHIKGNNGQLAVEILPSQPTIPDENFRRRDLNVIPILFANQNKLQYGLIAYAGVFTLTGGVWTVPVSIAEDTVPVMQDANLDSTFKQAMNQYVCATASLYSRKTGSMFHIFFGGISYGYFDNGVFQTDSEIPFINQVTTVKMDKNGNFAQYIMDTEYPVILSTRSNPGNQLLFGAGAFFIPNSIMQYSNYILSLDSIREPTVIGHIVGGIASTLPNTNDMADSVASQYVFKVTLIPV